MVASTIPRHLGVLTVQHELVCIIIIDRKFCPESPGIRFSSINENLRVTQPLKSSRLHATTMNPSNILFLIPGYLPPGRVVEPDAADVGTGAPAAMQWESGLVQQPWQANFEQFLGFTHSVGLHLPMARLMCPDHKALQGLVCADPIHLQADRDTAKLIPAEMLALSDQESEDLVKAINTFLLADEMVLTRRSDSGWYLSGMDASTLESFPPSFLANRNASAFLPDGKDSEQWRRLMTELQMLLHTHPVNEKRVQQGKLPVNSLWFWGGAALYSSSLVTANELENFQADDNTQPMYALETDGLMVFADDAFTRAACADLDVPCKALREFDPQSPQESLVVDTRIANAIFARNESEMHRVIDQIEKQWLAPLSGRIHQGDVVQFSLVNEDGDRGVLNRELQRAYSRSENRLVKALKSMKMPRQLSRWVKSLKRS